MIYEIDEFDNEFQYFTKDKIARLEGICVEQLFLNDLLRNDQFKLSPNWWYVKKKDYRDRLVKEVKDHISELDIKLSEIFLESNRLVFFVQRKPTAKNVFAYRACRFKKGLNGPDHMALLKKGIDIPVRNAPLKDKSKEDVQRYNETLEYLKNHDPDVSSTIASRVMANYFGTTVMWDIDVFLAYRNELFALEVKQKFPTSNNTYGLNKGSRFILSYLDHCLFKVIHVVLTKPEEKDSSAVEQLQNEYRQKANWLIHHFTRRSFENLSKKEAPEETSMSGKKEVRFYEEDVNSFQELGHLKEVNSSHFKSFIDSIISGDR